jgi:alkylation response protein AidB-like acyl-CoA dehydrogenase
MQIQGGYGYMRESESERLYRDCRVLRIYEGTSQIQLLTIARSLARRRDEGGAVV